MVDSGRRRLGVVCALGLACLAGALWLHVGPAAVRPEDMAPDGLPGAPARRVAAGDPSDRAGADPQVDSRRGVAQRIRVVDAGDGRPIGGAEIHMFDAQDEQVALRRCDAAGYADIGGVSFEGCAAAASGYGAVAAEPGVDVIRMLPPDTVEVRAVGLRPEVVAAYDLRARLTFGPQRYPLEFARRVGAMHPSTAPLQGDRCFLERPIAGAGDVALLAVHKGTGRVSEFDKRVIAAGERLVEFDCSGYSTPTGNWLRLELEPPEVEGAGNLQVHLEYADKGGWSSWATEGALYPQRGDAPVRIDFVELWERSYRVTVRVYGTARGVARIPPFTARGGVTRRLDLRDRGGASITLRFVGQRGEPSEEFIAVESPAGSSPPFVQRIGRSLRCSGLAPGSYTIRPATWGKFDPIRQTVVAGQRVALDVALRRLGMLALSGLDAQTPVSVSDPARAVAVPRDRLGWNERRKQFSLVVPRAVYAVRIPGRPEMRVEVGAVATTLDCTTGIATR